MTVHLFKSSICFSGIVLSAVLAASYAFAAKPQTFTGTIGDAVCGAEHICSRVIYQQDLQQSNPRNSRSVFLSIDRAQMFIEIRARDRPRSGRQ